MNVYDSLTGTMYDAIDVPDENRCWVNVFDDIAVQYTGWEEGSLPHVYVPGQATGKSETGCLTIADCLFHCIEQLFL